jgi:hypothetical protein
MASDSFTAMPRYKAAGDVETSPSYRYGSLLTSAERKKYRGISTSLASNAPQSFFQGASSFAGSDIGFARINYACTSPSFDTHLTRAVATFSNLAKKFAVFGGALLADSESTVSSPKVDAKLHLHNIKQYEAVRSRRYALNYMFHTLEDAFERKEVEMLNFMLYSAADELLGSSMSVSLLRATFRARNELAMWSYYRDVVQHSLRDDPDAKKLLRGLVE